MADRLRDLELLFQEQHAVLAKDATEQQALRKGKAVATDPSLPRDHYSIMVLEEESKATPTRPDELITSQPEGGSRWFEQRMPCTGSAFGDSTQIRRLEDSCPSPALPASTSENAEEGTVQTVAVADKAVPAIQPVPAVTVVPEQTEQPEQPNQSAGPGATEADATHRAYRNARVSVTILRRY